NPDGTHVRDWGNDKRTNLAKLPTDDVVILDSWNPAGFFENAFYTEPFQEVLLKGNLTPVRQQAPAKPSHMFKAKAPLLIAGETLCLLGSAEALKNWDIANPILLSREEREDLYTAAVDLSGCSFPLFYKYGVYNLAGRRFVRFEDGANRVLPAPTSAK